MTFFVIVALGLSLLNLEVEILPTDLVFFSVSILIVYLFFSINKRGESGELKEVKKVEKLADKIYKKRKSIFKKIDKKSNLDDYFYLKVEYEKGNVKSEKFQKRYKKFYNMYVFGFTDEFYEKYFEFMDSGVTDLKKILKSLSKIKDKNGKKSVQLAFASKLIHTIDSEMPLYNSTVSNLFDLSIPKGDIEKKINSSLKIYDELKSYHGSLAGKDQIKRSIIEFRKRNDFKEGVLSDAKIIDLFIKSIS